MTHMKIVDKLSGEEIMESELIGLCSNPSISTDTWHLRNELIDNMATDILNLYNVCDADYPVFALADDGRHEGAVWFPVTVTRSE